MITLDVSRQSALVPTEKMATLTHHVVGCGAIGREVAMQLASMGASRIWLYDFDTVDDSNVVTQGYAQADIGKRKGSALFDAIMAVNPEVEIEVSHKKVNGVIGPELGRESVLYATTDNIESRGYLFHDHWGHSECPLLLDSRVLGETIRAIACTRPEGAAHYAKTLFKPSEAVRGVCSARMTIYAARIGASLLTHNLARWLRGLPVHLDVTIDLLPGILVHEEV